MTENYEKDFVPYEQALALKELGFDEPCFAYYDMAQEFNFPGCTMHNRNFINLKATMTPLYQQAFRWFREKHGLYSVIDGLEHRQYYKITQLNSYSKEYDTYEEAEQACLDKLIEICKTK